jgi:hypothetical protein
MHAIHLLHSIAKRPSLKLKTRPLFSLVSFHTSQLNKCLKTLSAYKCFESSKVKNCIKLCETYTDCIKTSTYHSFLYKSVLFIQAENVPKVLSTEKTQQMINLIGIYFTFCWQRMHIRLNSSSSLPKVLQR